MATHVLFESATGYAVFQVKFHEEIAQRTKQVQESLQDVAKFGQMVVLKSFVPYRDAAHALENANDVSEGVLNPFLATTLEQVLPGKKKAITLGVAERGLAGAIKSNLGYECDTSERSLEIIRGIRLHAEKLLKGLQSGDVVRAQLGLGHAYSRAKVKFNVNRSDNMIIQSIALLDQLDKDVNLFSMRVREWYGWHFPELVRIIPDNHQYAKVIQVLGDKSKVATGTIEDHSEIIGKITDTLDGDESRAKNVVEAARVSMGTDISPIDLINIANFASRVIHLFAYRTSLQDYLAEKMSMVAPNLGALIGNTVGARLISHAGSLTNLSKYPASTVQILGAEKALFRALKTKGNTPKYGLIYHSTFIGRAGTKNKGRISRFLANKCSIASRIDCFADTPTTKFGDALRDQVEERLAFYETGASPTKNSEAMAKVLDNLRGERVVVDRETNTVLEGEVTLDKGEKRKKKKRKSDAMEVEELAVEANAEADKKKRKSRPSEVEAHVPKVSDTPAAPLSSLPPDDYMDLDASLTDKAARKAAKKAKKAAAAAAIVTPATAEGVLASAVPPSELKKEKKKKRKSEGMLE